MSPLHFLVGCLLLTVLATTLFGQLASEPRMQPAFATAQAAPGSAPSRGFAAFGHGPALRNLVF